MPSYISNGIKYLKINRYDSGGIDRSDYLGQLTSLRIAYDDIGTQQYNIISVQEQSTYYVYGIQPKNHSLASNNYEVLNYNFTASTIYSQVVNNTEETIINYTNISSSNDIINYFTSSTGYFNWGNTPNVPIKVTISASTNSGTSKLTLYHNATQSLSFSTPDRKSFVFTGSNSFIELDNMRLTSVAPVGTQVYVSMSISISSPTILSNRPVSPVLTIFNPEFINWDYNDYNPLFGNAEIDEASSFFMDVDYGSGLTTPINFDLIISGTADPAFVQDSNYTSQAWSNIRYNGVESNSPDFNQLTTNGGYGALPNVEQNKTYIAYFDGVGGTGPELIDQTAYFIKYLIDEQGNVVNPEPDTTALYNLLDSYEVEKNALVRLISTDPILTENPNDNALTGIHPITAVGSIQSILVSETGSGRLDYARTMSFTDVQGNPVTETIQSYIGTATCGDLSLTSPVPTRVQFVPTSQPINDPITGQAGIFEGASNYWYKINNSSNGANASVLITLGLKIKNIGNEATSCNVRIMRDQTATYPYIPPTTVVLYNFGLQAGAQCEIQPWHNWGYAAGSYDKARGGKINTPFWVEVNDKFYVEIEGGNGITVQSWQSNILSINQTPQPGYLNANGTNMATSSYWSQGSNEYSGGLAIDTSKTTHITASQALTDMFRSGVKQIASIDMINWGLSPISLPFSLDNLSPFKGDWIRFEYNKDYRLFNIVNIGINSGSVPSEDRLFLELYPAFTSGSLKLDHFVMYRIVNDGTYVVLNVKKPLSGSSFTGIIQPQYVSKTMKDNYNDIIQNLTQKGLIQ